LWSIDGALTKKVCQWEGDAHQACEEEECRKMGPHWVDGDSDQMMDDKDKNTNNMSESGSEDDKDDPEEIKALKV